jgi:hypothetical protein
LTATPADEVAVADWFGGQVMVGGVVSTTVTVNEQVEVLFAASATMQVTDVVPKGKVEPGAGVQDGIPTPGQLSLTAGAA